MKIEVIKLPGGILAPASDIESEKLQKLKTGGQYCAEIKQRRNVKFHRKFFALLNIGYEAFEPGEVIHNGIPVAKNFERFRKDVIISAGFYELVVNINGDAKAEAKSISFSSMKADEFEGVYSAVCNVLLQKVLKNYTKADLDEVVERVINF